jgi:hypothetical protein
MGPDQVSPYEYHRQSARSPSISLGTSTHLSHAHPLGSRHDPSYNASSESSSYSGAANHRPTYLPHVHTSRLGTPFLDQNTDSGQTTLLSEVRRMSAHISSLQEAQGRLLTGLEKMEVRVDALENPPEDEAGTGSRAKMAAGSKSGANEHPSVKASQHIIPPMMLQLNSPFISQSSTRCSMVCVGWTRAVTKQNIPNDFVP